MSGTNMLWEPSKGLLNESIPARFIARLQSQGVPVKDWHSLYSWSVEAPGDFWREVAQFCEIKFIEQPTSILEPVPHSETMAARWFKDARLNFAENLLQGPDENLAVIFRGEDSTRQALTYGQLRQQVSSLAAFLRSRGVQVGDRVAALMPNLNETVVAMLAASSIGAIFTSTAPAFGTGSVIDRFAQVQPSVLVISNGYYYGGKRYTLDEKYRQLIEQLPSVRTSIVVNHLSDYSFDAGADNGSPGYMQTEWETIMQTNSALTFSPLPFDHPLYILYSSGTTGKPKCIVHGAGGTLLEHLKELALHSNVDEDDVVFYQTNCGWMMWNWLVSALARRATVVLYDGSPLIDDGRHLFRIAEEESITVFGTNPKFLSLVQKKGIEPQKEANLSSIHTILSTGSPLLDANFNFVYSKISQDACLSSISGGTDIVGCFALGSPMLPVRKGELQTRSLGLKVQVFDEEGCSVVGEKGELVCSAPFPSMPVFFWNDDQNQSRYRKAYFSKYSGIWRHGDFVLLNEHGGMIFYGRSDAVLNPGGVRLGTAELYREVEIFPEIVEALAIGQKWDDDIRVVLFVCMKEGSTLTEDLISEIKLRIKTNASPFHVPSKIIQVPDIPRTRSGKIVELAVAQIIEGQEPQNLGALANPEALEHFRNMPSLKE